MALAAPVRSITEFTLGRTDGPTLVYLDVAIADEPPRRLRIELFDEELPYTTTNFRLLCTGERKGNAKVRALWYKQSRFHRIVPGFMMQGGDITHGNGAGGAPAYSRAFEDEVRLIARSMIMGQLTHPLYTQHQVGSVSMAHQNNSNKSQFFISFLPVRDFRTRFSRLPLTSSAPQASWCDGKHVVFGQVLHEDLPHLSAFESVGSASGRPLKPVVVVDCGQLSGDGYTPVAAT
ncbi:hypothetical protein Poli38472_010248 [Pythium oligandrum]|uniref:Peptidyl-prolyl cis-trans isomerase n=1 Tax=Pythium oligandrum TaxID=41045 RepID=A0A8K1C8L1_PYTOL|nr:hypothetical protein Poli38472_010248 [Pythium oligandrum]|eukprot:TMW58689.1 hypothetical protein Poli38472_010248 [Pythium oligandrum]